MTRTIASGTVATTATGAQAEFYATGRSRTGVRRERVFASMQMASGGSGTVALEVKTNGTDWDVLWTQAFTSTQKFVKSIDDIPSGVPCRLNMTVHGDSGTFTWAIIT